MRKKFLAFVTAIITISGLLYANNNNTACVYTTYCGIPVLTVCPGYFDNYADLFSYQADLDDIYCNNGK